MFGDGDDIPEWDEPNIFGQFEQLREDVAGILRDRVEGEQEPVDQEVIDDAEDNDNGDNDDDPDSDDDDTPFVEIIESEYLAPDNQADSSWELAHHYFTFEEAQNYCDGGPNGYKVPLGVLYIVVNEDGSADVYRDPSYGESEVVA